MERYSETNAGGGVRINLSGDSEEEKEINFWNAHLTAYPYGPYGFCNDGKSQEEVLEIEAEPGALDGVERNLRFADEVVRHKVMRLPDSEAHKRGLLGAPAPAPAADAG